MGWIQEFKIGDVFKGVWEDINRGLKGGFKAVANLIQIPFLGGEKVLRRTLKGVGTVIQTVVSSLTPAIIILGLIVVMILIFWKQIKKAI